ncbi:Clp protease N-terminal domain-containing protein [Nocardia sp. NPDC020380]|uniref:Clp protease N-terminal domain-containing protein n=1 Tax=Nocardia sp. NPDC020380 TaxID=3364309 RepID=UPI0037BB72D2
MFERLTEQSKQVIRVAQDAAISMRNDFIGTEHFLLGLAATSGAAGEVLDAQGAELGLVRAEVIRQSEAAGVSRTGGQVAIDALSSIGIDVTEIQRRADDSFGRGVFLYPRPAFTVQGKQLLAESLRESLELGDERIDTGHILLGLLDADPDSIAAQTLAALGVDTAALRSATLDRLARRAS